MICEQLTQRQSWGETGIHADLWLNTAIKTQSRDDKDSRKALLEKVATLPEPPEYALHFAHWEQALEAYGAQKRRIKVNGRMIVGLGHESVLETSICLHRTYGVPYIPGSALKGLAASYAHQCLGGDWQKDGMLHRLVFGTTQEAGYITFLDALYIPNTGFEINGQARGLHSDVITVHHPKYYQGENNVPMDRDDPNPVPFLSATGSYLLALVAPDLKDAHTRWIDLTYQILARALEEYGIGARTSSSYGRMIFLDDPVRPIDPEIKRAEVLRANLEKLRENEVAGQIHAFYQHWQQLTSPQARQILAQAILFKVEQAGRTKASAEKGWYKELSNFLREQR